MDFNFGEVLTRAWQIIWKHKILWVFGILASCSRGGGGGGSGSSGYRVSGEGGPSGQPFPLQQQMERLGEWISQHPWVVILLVLVFLVILVLAIFLGAIGKIGLIKGTYKAEQGAEGLVLGELFSESTPYFWRVFGLSFLIGLAFLILFIPFILFGVLTAGVGFTCLLPLICILIPVSVVVSLIIEQANNAMVLEDLGMMDGLRRGWEVVKSNVGPVLIMAILLFVIAFVVGLVVALPLIITLVPLIIGMVAGNTAPLWIAGICFCLYLPVLIIVNGILTSYLQSAWTLTFLRLTHKPAAGDAAAPPATDNRTLTSGPNA